MFQNCKIWMLKKDKIFKMFWWAKLINIQVNLNKWFLLNIHIFKAGATSLKVNIFFIWLYLSPTALTMNIFIEKKKKIRYRALVFEPSLFSLHKDQLWALFALPGAEAAHLGRTEDPPLSKDRDLGAGQTMSPNGLAGLFRKGLGAPGSKGYWENSRTWLLTLRL